MRRRSLRPTLCAASLLVSAGALEAQQECRGLTAGSLLLAEDAGAVFVAEYGASGVALVVLFIAFGAPGWDTQDLTFEPWRRPQLADTTRFLTGASIGRLFLQYNPRTHVAWADTIRVALADDNVIVVDSAHTDRVVVRSLLRVDPAIPMADACAARARNDFDSLRSAVYNKLLREPTLSRLFLRNP
jgi:hypothetical protein